MATKLENLNAGIAASSGYAGKMLMARDFVSYVNVHWPNQKTKAVATGIAESQLSVGAWHVNLNNTKDCGVLQIDIPASQVGTQAEWDLRTESKEFADWDPVVKNNVKAAYKLWTQPWVRDGHADFRRWQPWVAYTSGWAMYPEAWAWHHDADGNPVGPWVASGRYLHKAIRGIANWYIYNTKTMDSTEALAEGRRLAAQYGITKGYLTYNAKNGVYWVYPPAPEHEPTEAPWGYPVKNNGF